MMSAEIRHLAPCVVPPEAEVVMHPKAVVGLQRSGTEPEVIVELRGSGRVGPQWTGMIRLRDTNMYFLDFADKTISHEHACLPELFARTLLRSGLDDPFVLASGVDHPPLIDI